MMDISYMSSAFISQSSWSRGKAMDHRTRCRGFASELRPYSVSTRNSCCDDWSAQFSLTKVHKSGLKHHCFYAKISLSLTRVLNQLHILATVDNVNNYMYMVYFMMWCYSYIFNWYCIVYLLILVELHGLTWCINVQCGPTIHQATSSYVYHTVLTYSPVLHYAGEYLTRAHTSSACKTNNVLHI